MERLTTRTDDGRGVCRNSAHCTCDSLCDYMRDMIGKLADHEDLEEQGLLMKLPCKVGETIFVIIQGEMYELELKDYRRNPFIGGLDLYCINTKDKYDYRWIWNRNPNVFLTREQAEQALKEMEIGE